MNLASSGATELQLKRAGQWKSFTSAREYLDDNLKARTNQLSRLDTGVLVVTPKKTLVENLNSETVTKVQVTQNKNGDAVQPGNVLSAVNSIITISASTGNIVVYNNFYSSPAM